MDKAAATGAREISTMINARVAPNYSGIAGAFTAVLTRLRAWASTALSAGATIPLAPGLFDLLIVDEASQCAIPQIVPLLFRAKRALILGDAQQLAPIASMAKADEQRLMVEAGLDTESMSRRDLVYSQRSVFDVMAKRCERVQLLDEHYRSHPQIIELSNRLFYEGRLTVLTDPKGLVDFGKNAVARRNVVGMATRPDAGSAINNDEAAAVAEEVVRLMSRQEALTVGVVTTSPAAASETAAGAALAASLLATAARAPLPPEAVVTTAVPWLAR